VTFEQLVDLQWRSEETHCATTLGTSATETSSYSSSGLLSSLLDVESVEREPRLLGPAQPDFIAHLRGGGVAIIEAKLVTPATLVRLDRTAAQLHSYQQAYLKVTGGDNPPQLVLVVSGALAAEHVRRLKSLGVDTVFDGPALWKAAPGFPWPKSVARERPDDSVIYDRSVTAESSLIGQLETISPGRAAWSFYQRTVRDILAAALCPPLDHPLSEHSNVEGINRRDMIFPNYADEGLWKFLRDHYEAHYVVVDAKNYAGAVKKNEILQMANYLSAHGPGLFGIIVCRDAADRSADVTRREQWIIHRKLIIILNDDDLKQMMSFVASNADPGNVIRQKSRISASVSESVPTRPFVRLLTDFPSVSAGARHQLKQVFADAAV